MYGHYSNNIWKLIAYTDFVHHSLEQIPGTFRKAQKD